MSENEAKISQAELDAFLAENPLEETDTSPKALEEAAQRAKLKAIMAANKPKSPPIPGASLNQQEVDALIKKPTA